MCGRRARETVLVKTAMGGGGVLARRVRDTMLVKATMSRGGVLVRRIRETMLVKAAMGRGGVLARRVRDTMLIKATMGQGGMLVRRIRETMLVEAAMGRGGVLETRVRDPMLIKVTIGRQGVLTKRIRVTMLSKMQDGFTRAQNARGIGEDINVSRVMTAPVIPGTLMCGRSGVGRTRRLSASLNPTVIVKEARLIARRRRAGNLKSRRTATASCARLLNLHRGREG